MANIDDIISNAFNKKKKKEEENNVNISNASSVDKIVDTAFFKKNINFDTFQSDLAKTAQTIDSIYNGWQTKETMANTLSSVQSMYDRIGKYQEYQKKYGGADLSELQSSYKNVLDGWEDISKHYGKYENAEAYTNALKAAEKSAIEYEGMKTADIEGIKTEITDLEEMLKTAKSYQNNAQAMRNKSNTWEHRSNGLNTDGGYGGKVNSAENEYNEYLKSTGYGSVEEIEKALGEKKLYKNKAEWIQKGIELSSVGDETSENYDKDFAEKSKYVAPKERTGFRFEFGAQDEDIYKYINDESYRNDKAKFINGSAEASILTVGYEYMTDKEKQTYNYYYNSGDIEKANEYLNTISEDLSNRKAVNDFKNIENKTFDELTYGVAAGLDQFASGIKNFFNFSDEYIPVNSTQQLSGMIREDLQYNHGSLGQVGYDLINTTSNMLPSILISAVTPVVGSYVGAASMGLSAGGNAYQEMLNLGYDKGQATTYSLLVGASEAGLQHLMGGIGKLGGVSGKLSKIVSSVDNAFAKFAMQWGGSALSEGFEEAAQEVLTPLFSKIAAGYDTGEEVNWEEVVYSGLLGALSGGLLEGAPLAVNSISEHRFNTNMGKNIKANDRVNELLELVGDESVGEAYEVYTRYANKGINAENISNAQLGNLYSTTKSEAINTLKSKKATDEQRATALQNAFKLAEIDKAVDEGIQKKAKQKELETTAKKNFNVDKKTDESVITETGKAISYKDINIGEDKVRVATENGDISIDDTTLSLKDAELVEMASRIAKEEGENLANTFLHNYDKETSLDEYQNSFNLAIAYAKNDFSYNHIFDNKGSLSTEMVSEIYKEVTVKAAKEQAQKIAELNQKMADMKFYKGVIDESAIDYDNTSAEGKVNWNDLTEKQRKAVTFVKGFAQATGMNLVFAANNPHYNGKYDRDSNTIYINLDEGGLDRATGLVESVIPTLSHETTHWMRKKSPELWNKLNEVVFSTLVEHHNKNITDESPKITELDLIKREYEKLVARDLKNGKEINKKALEDEAREEIIARACEDILSMSKQGRKIFDSLSIKEQNTLVGKIKELIQNLLDWVDELLHSYKSNPQEAKILREYKDSLNKAIEIWDEMLEQSVVANQSLEKSGAYTHTNSTVNDGVFSEKEIIGISGKSYGIGVYLDSNLLTDLTDDERKEMVKEFVVTELAGEHFIAYDNNNDAVDIRLATKKEYFTNEKGKRRQVLRELYNKYNGLKIKQEAIVLIDELIANAKFEHPSKAKHKHGWLDNNGQNDWDIWTVYIQEKNKTVWEATLNIANTANGEKILYDIDPIKIVEQASKSATSTTNPIIRNSDKNVNTKPEEVKEMFSERFSEKNADYSGKDYSYESFIAKPDMKLTVLDSNVPSNRADIIHEAKKKASKIGKVNAKDKTVSVFVDDIERDILLGTDGLKHSLNRGKNLQNQPIGIVTLNAGEIIKNSIKINELTPSKKSARGSYVLIGAAKDSNDNLYIVRFVVNDYDNTLESMDALYAINTKKESDVLNAPRYANDSLSVTDSIISIANLLDYVNKYFPDILPESILKHYGYDARPDGELGENALYSEKEDTVYSIMGETERILKENEKFKAEIERLKERLALEKKVTGGKYFNENQLGAVAGHLRKLANNSTMDKVELMKALKDLYSYIAHSPEVASNEVWDKSYAIAKALMDEAKPITIYDSYSAELLREIRNTRISLDETQKKEASYIFDKHWNRYFFGNVIITDKGTPIEVKWQEWHSLYPDVFADDLSDGDKIRELYDIINSLKEASETVDKYSTEELTRELAYEVYNQYWNVSPIRTTADKYDKQIKRLNFEHRQMMNEIRTDYETRLTEQGLADDIYYGRKLGEQKSKYESKLKEKNARIEKQKELYKKLRERKDEEIAIAKQHGKDLMNKYKDNAQKKTYIQRIITNALTLNKWLTKNSKDYHIHEAMKGPVVKLLNAIDFSSKTKLEGGMPTEKDISFAEAFSEVKAMLQDADNMVEGLESLYGHDLSEKIDLISKASFRLVGDNNYVINAMSNDELSHLDYIVTEIKRVVTEVNKFHTIQHTKGAVNLANEFMEHGEKIGNIKKQHGKIAKFFEFRNRTPYYFFKDLGDVGAKLFKAFQDGWDKLAFNSKTVIDYANETYTNKEVKEWSKETKKFNLAQKDGKTRAFEMSIAQIMALHCVSKQEDAKTHLLSGGMTLKRLDSKGHVITDYENITLTDSDIQTILDSLTDRQREVADKLQEFMNTVCSEWGNEISMARFGIKMFGLPDYFPIKVSEATVPTDNTKDIDNASLFRLLNMSFTKSRNKNAKQSIEVGDIFDIFAQHASDMAKYNALALPVLDFNKFYSIHGEDSNGKEYGVVKTLKSVFGDEANGYIRRFVRDLNGSQNVSRDVIGNTFFKNAKLASVAANLRVVLLQPTAFHKAGAVMDNKYLLKASAYILVEPIGMVKKLKKAIANAEKYCGIVQWKSLGYYDTDISKGIAEKIKHADTLKDKLIEKSMRGAEIADKVTFGTLWVACEFEIRDTRTDLKVGSEEFYTAIAERLRDVIYATQVVDSTMTRSDMMRSADRMDKVWTTFGSEPTIAYNMLLDVVTTLNRDKQVLESELKAKGLSEKSAKKEAKKQATKKNSKKIRKVVTAYVITNAVAALVESGFDALRDDDDEEMDVAEFMKLYFKNFASDMSISNKLPILKDIVSILQGYSSTRIDTQWISNLYYAGKDIFKLAEGEGNLTKLAKDGIKAMSYMTGLPAYNVWRDAMAVLDKLGITEEED